MTRWIVAFRASLTSPLFLILAGLTALYTLAGYVLAGVYDWPVALHTSLYSNVIWTGTELFLIGFVCYRALYIMFAVRPARLTRAIFHDLRDNYFTPERLAHGIPVIILFIIMLSVFTSFKSMIPEINPFQYDALFARIDKAIHFGKQPWDILFPVLKIAAVTTFLSFIYKTWFVAKFCTLFWQGFSTSRPRLREQFFLTYMLSWIINGTVLATILSSAGPCYYGHIVDGPDPYAPLMSFLHESNKISPVWDLFAQDYLWKAYSNVSITLFSGISAMPSMHISLAFLYALLGWGIGRKTGIFFTVYAVLMFLASVHLGWHYAIDGYLGAAVTWAIWWGVGKCLRSKEIPAN